MKKLISMVLLLALCFSVAVSAAGEAPAYTYVNGNVEIQITGENLTDDEIERIVALLENGGYGISVCNPAICALLGHDIKESAATMTRHCIYDTYPRCETTFYIIYTCQRCSYENAVVSHIERVGCCS